MKKKIIIISILLIISAGLIQYFLTKEAKYTYKYHFVDEVSPYDVELSFYKNNKLISIKKAKYTDGTDLCTGKNPTVNIHDIKDEKEIIIVLDNDKEVVALYFS